MSYDDWNKVDDEDDEELQDTSVRRHCRRQCSTKLNDASVHGNKKGRHSILH